MTTKTITHTVTLPPNTDVPQFIGVHRNLMESMQIPHQLSFFDSVQSFTHPIPECQKQLTTAFFEFFRQLQDLKSLYGSVMCTNATVGNSTVTFVFTYQVPSSA
jgi:hypothetical protein